MTNKQKVKIITKYVRPPRYKQISIRYSTFLRLKSIKNLRFTNPNWDLIINELLDLHDVIPYIPLKNPTEAQRDLDHQLQFGKKRSRILEREKIRGLSPAQEVLKRLKLIHPDEAFTDDDRKAIKNLREKFLPRILEKIEKMDLTEEEREEIKRQYNI